jgi:hypothetical protein
LPTIGKTVEDAIRIFSRAVYPMGLTPRTAWLGIYQGLLWYEPVKLGHYTSLPHIIDADKLRPSKSRRTKRQPFKPTAWQRRAEASERYIAGQLGCPTDQVQPIVDRLMRTPRYAGLQRQNSLGIAFIGVVRHILQTFGSPQLTYEMEVNAASVFPGITMPGRSTSPSIDILIEKGGVPRAIVSAKWSLRHDRINDITNECPIYKAASMRSRKPLAFYVVSNEFDPARLSKVLADDCIDGLAHVHKPLVTSVCELNGRLDPMLDLSDLIEATKSL